ncbi:MAG: DUF4397 domain-containing protein [Fimbriimonas sp.]
MRKVLPYLLGTICAFAAVGCGGSGETIIGTEQNPRVRALNAVTTVTPVDIRVSDDTISENSTFGSLSEYEIFENGNREVTALDSDTNGEIATLTDLFELSRFYTVVAYNDGEGVSIAQLTDDRSVPDNRAQIRVVHLGNGQGNVDVYITAPDADISNSVPTISNVPFETLSGDQIAYQDLTPGNRQVRVTQAGTTNVIAGLNTTLSLTDGTSRTLYIVNSGEGYQFINVDDRD